MYLTRKKTAFTGPFIFMTAVSCISVVYLAVYGSPHMPNSSKRIRLVSSVLFSGFVILGNYECFSEELAGGTIFTRAVLMLLTAICGVILMCHILDAAYQLSERSAARAVVFNTPTYEKAVFWFSFLLIAGIYSLILFLCYYPGTINYDGLKQIWQVLSNAYDNRHPFYHTQIIRLFLFIGMKGFNDINLGIALYSFFQIFTMAGCFAYQLKTMAEVRIPKGCLMITLAGYLTMPYHVIMSFTMFKDVLYSGMILLMVTAAYRMILGLSSNSNADRILFIISSLMTCLLRLNGLLMYFLTFVTVLVFFRKGNKSLLIMAGSIIILGAIMMGPVLRFAGIEGFDPIEARAMPLQQITRVYLMENDLSKEETEMLSKLADLSKVSETYNPSKADPMKELVRNTGEQRYLKENGMDYLKLWIALGIRHPLQYLTAWIEETRGYWNAGYPCVYLCDVIIGEGSGGIHKTVRNEKLRSWMTAYLWSFMEKTRFGHPGQLFVSMGLLTWLVGAVMTVARMRRVKTVFLAVPAMLNLATLLFGVSVFSEFRYDYPMFLCAPLVFSVILFQKTQLADAVHKAE